MDAFLLLLWCVLLHVFLPLSILVCCFVFLLLLLLSRCFNVAANEDDVVFDFFEGPSLCEAALLLLLLSRADEWCSFERLFDGGVVFTAAVERAGFTAADNEDGFVAAAVEVIL